MLNLKNKIKDLLIQEEESLLNSSSETLPWQDPTLKEFNHESIAQSQEESNQRVISILSFKHKKRLKEIKNTLIHLEDPNFGECLDCEEPINEKNDSIMKK